MSETVSMTENAPQDERDNPYLWKPEDGEKPVLTDFEEGAALMGALMAQSAKDLAWTTNAIDDMNKAEIKRLRTLVLAMQQVFDEATVVDRETEGRWRLLQPRIWSVEDAVAREGESR